MARTAVRRTTIECCVRWCAARCAGSDTAEITSAESWKSARPTCTWCAAQQAASGASEAASWRLTVEALVERYALRCSGLTGTSEWCRMEPRAAQSCNGRFSREPGCMWVCVLSPESVDGVCDGSHVHGNCWIALRLTHGYRKSGDDRQWRRELSPSPPPAGRHPRYILTSKMTPLSTVWLCPWRALRTCLVGVRSVLHVPLLTSIARMDRPVAVLSTRIARWSWVSSAYWRHRTP